MCRSRDRGVSTSRRLEAKGTRPCPSAATLIDPRESPFSIRFLSSRPTPFFFLLIPSFDWLWSAWNYGAKLPGRAGPGRAGPGLA